MVEVPIGLFPDVILQWGTKRVRRRRNEIIEYRGGSEQRRRQWPGPLDLFYAKSDALRAADWKVLEDFNDLCEGSLQAFYYWRPDGKAFANYLVGSVAAATSIIVPFKGQWFINQAPFAATYTGCKIGATLGTAVAVAFTATPNIGANGEDRLNFASSTGNVYVTCSYARLRIVARNAGDDLNEEYMEEINSLRSMADIVIKQLR
jgi:hypothetical protein